MKKFVKEIIVRVLVFTMLASNTLSFFNVNDVNVFASGVDNVANVMEGETPESKVLVDETKDESEESKTQVEETKKEDSETNESGESESSQVSDAEKEDDDNAKTASDSDIEEAEDESSEEDGTEDVPEEVDEDESSEEDGEVKGEVFGPMTKAQMDEYKNRQELLDQEDETEDSDAEDLDDEDKEEASPSDADILGALNFDNLSKEVIEASLSEAADTPLTDGPRPPDPGTLGPGTLGPDKIATVNEAGIAIPEVGVVYWYTKDTDGDKVGEELHLAGIKPKDTDYKDGQDNYCDTSLTEKESKGIKTVVIDDDIYPTNCFNYFLYNNLATISNIDRLHTNNVTDMSAMFRMSNLTSLDVSNFDTSNVTNMASMFSDCSALTSLDLSNFDTSNVTDISNIFQNCYALKSVDLSSFDVSNVDEWFEDIFHECGALEYINISESFSYLVGRPHVGLTGEWVSASDPNGRTYTAETIPTGVAGEYYKVGYVPADILDDGPKEGRIYWYIKDIDGDGTKEELHLAGIKPTDPDYEEGHDNYGFNHPVKHTLSYDMRYEITKVVIDDEIILPSSSLHFFGNMYSLVTISNIHYMNTSHVTRFGYMFTDCNRLTSLDLRGFDTSNAKDMRGMFEDCKDLKSLDLSNWNTDKLTDILSMFDGCSSLESLDLSNFNTDNIIANSLDDYYGYTFIYCNALKHIKISASFSKSIAEHASSMWFSGEWVSADDPDGTVYTAADFPKDTAGEYYKVGFAPVPTPVEGKIYWYIKDIDGDGLNRELHLAGIKPKDPDFIDDGNHEDYYGTTFGVGEERRSWTKGIKKVVIDNKIILSENGTAFFSCFNELATISNIHYLDTSNVLYMHEMFERTPYVTSLDLRTLDVHNVENMYDLFGVNHYLESLDVSTWDTSNCYSFLIMFDQCESLKHIKISATFSNIISQTSLPGEWVSIDDPNGPVYDADTIPTGVAGEYIRYQRTKTVELHTGHGTIDPSLTTWEKTSDGVYKSEFNQGDKVELPGASSLKYEGHTFAGWFTEENGEGSNCELGFDSISENKTVYAYWLEDTSPSSDYVIMLLHTEGGALYTKIATDWTIVDKDTYLQSAKKGATITLPGDNYLEYEGYIFSGWHTEKNGEGSSVGLDLVVENVSENKDYYAYWIDKSNINGFIVTLFTRGGTLDKTATDGWNNVALGKYLHKYNEGEKATLPSKSDVKYDKYIFRGWLTEGDAPAPETIDTTSTYYAKWVKNPFDDVSTQSIIVEYNKGNANWVDPNTKESFKFVGNPVTLYGRDKLVLYNKYFDGWSLTHDKKDIITEISTNNIDKWIDYLNGDKIIVNAIFSDYSNENSTMIGDNIDAMFESMDGALGDMQIDGSIKVDLYKTNDTDFYYYYVRMHGSDTNARIIDFLNTDMKTSGNTTWRLSSINSHKLVYHIDKDDNKNLITAMEGEELISILPSTNKLITNIKDKKIIYVPANMRRVTVYSNVKEGESTYPSIATISVPVFDGMPMSNLPFNVTREGYSFVGFNTDKDNKGTSYTKDSIATSDVDELYMIWEPDEYKVKYSSVNIPYGDSQLPAIVPMYNAKTPETFTVKFDQPIPLLASASCIDPYTFKGWELKDTNEKVEEGDRWTFKGDASKEFVLSPANNLDGILVNVYENESATMPTMSMPCATEDANSGEFVSALADFVKVDDTGACKIKNEEEINELESSKEGSGGLFSNLLNKYKQFTEQTEKNIAQAMSFAITLVVEDGEIPEAEGWERVIDAKDTTYFRTIMNGVELELPKPVNNAKKDFIGWCENKDGTGEYVTLIGSELSSSKTYYAIWDETNTKEIWTVTIDLKGKGSTNDNGWELSRDGVYIYTKEVDKNTRGFELNLPKVSGPEGYTLIGWKVNGVDVKGETVTINKDQMIIDAVWAENWTVTINANGGEIDDEGWEKQENGIYIKTVEAIDDSIKLPQPSTLSKKGYTFANYVNNVDGSIYTITDYYAYKGYNVSINWKEITYTVNFVDESGDSSNPYISVTKTYGEDLDLDEITKEIGNANFFTDKETTIEYKGEDLAENADAVVEVYCVFNEEDCGDIYYHLINNILKFSHNNKPNYKRYTNDLIDSSIEKIIIEDNITITNNNKRIFSNRQSLNEIVGLQKVNIDELTNMSYMFFECDALISVDLSSWNLENITDMSSLFYGCDKLKSVKFGDECNTSNVLNMNNMFNGCSNLEEVIFGKTWDTSKVEDMKYMFFGCTSLNDIEDEVAKWDIKNTTDKNCMFGQ